MSAEHLDLRTERDRTPGAYRPATLGNGEYRNVYRRPDGSLRIGPAWRDPEAAFLGCEILPGESFVEMRDTRAEQIDGSAMVVARPEATSGSSDRRALAQAQGYTGDACTNCGNFSLRRSGTCLCCDACGSTTGCS